MHKVPFHEPKYKKPLRMVRDLPLIQQQRTTMRQTGAMETTEAAGLEVWSSLVVET